MKLQHSTEDRPHYWTILDLGFDKSTIPHADIHNGFRTHPKNGPDGQSGDDHLGLHLDHLLRLCHQTQGGCEIQVFEGVDGCTPRHLRHRRAITRHMGRCCPWRCKFIITRSQKAESNDRLACPLGCVERTLLHRLDDQKALPFRSPHLHLRRRCCSVDPGHHWIPQLCLRRRHLLCA